jgi:hypothetical protein
MWAQAHRFTLPNSEYLTTYIEKLYGLTHGELFFVKCLLTSILRHIYQIQRHERTITVVIIHGTSCHLSSVSFYRDMDISAIADRLGLSVVYGLPFTVSILKCVCYARSLLTLDNLVRLFIYRQYCVQSVAPSTCKVSRPNVECLLRPPCLVCIVERRLSILLELSS